MIRTLWLAVIVTLTVSVPALAQTTAATKTPAPAPAAQKSPGGGQVFVIETMKGTIEIETYPNEAPKTVDHILALIKRNFYNGQRILRIVPGQLVQFGDPQTRDMTKQAWWGAASTPAAENQSAPRSSARNVCTR